MRGDPSRLWSLSTRWRDATGTSATSCCLLVLVACAVLVAGCASGPDSGPGTAAPPNDRNAREQQAAADALAAYEGFWRVSNLAYAKPSAKDWRPELSAYATQDVLDGALDDIKNYASFPAHVEGELRRSPRVEGVVLETPERVVILDCIDIHTSRLVADRTGADLGDRTNQASRYRYRAEVVRDAGAPRWQVTRAAALVAEPC